MRSHSSGTSLNRLATRISRLALSLRPARARWSCGCRARCGSRAACCRRPPWTSGSALRRNCALQVIHVVVQRAVGADVVQLPDSASAASRRGCPASMQLLRPVRAAPRVGGKVLHARLRLRARRGIGQAGGHAAEQIAFDHVTPAKRGAAHPGTGAAPRSRRSGRWRRGRRRAGRRAGRSRGRRRPRCRAALGEVLRHVVGASARRAGRLCARTGRSPRRRRVIERGSWPASTSLAMRCPWRFTSTSHEAIVQARVEVVAAQLPGLADRLRRCSQLIRCQVERSKKDRLGTSRPSRADGGGSPAAASRTRG